MYIGTYFCNTYKIKNRHKTDDDGIYYTPTESNILPKITIIDRLILISI